MNDRFWTHEVGCTLKLFSLIIGSIILWSSLRQIIYGVQQQQAITLHNKALTQVQQGCFDEAIIFYKQSLALSECIGDIENNAGTLGMLGQLLADVKEDFDTGLNYLQKSLEILQRIQSPHAETVRGIINRIQNSRH